MKTLLAVAFLLYLSVPALLCKTNEEKLKAKLLPNIDTTARPVADDHDIIKVSFGLSINDAIVEKEYKNSVLITLKSWHQYMWSAPELTWNPDEYGGVKSIRVNPKAIWTPDVVLFNGVDLPSQWDEALVVVSNDGSVIWVPPATEKLTCPKKGDTIECKAVIGSWTYSAEEINLDFWEDKAETGVDYFGGLEYEIVNNSAERDVKKYECCPEKYISLKFNVFLKQK
jgi:hypothetical protein